MSRRHPLGGLLARAGCFSDCLTGDWVSAIGTVVDFVARAWGAVAIVVVAVLMERATQPTPARLHAPVIQAGVVPALLYFVMAALAATLPGWMAT